MRLTPPESDEPHFFVFVWFFLKKRLRDMARNVNSKVRDPEGFQYRTPGDAYKMASPMGNTKF